MKINHARLMIAAPASGSGKTTVTIALLAALQRRGLKPAAFKCGPDYIDPMFYRQVLACPTYNLDRYFVGREIINGLIGAAQKNADISILEGVMGYYDGAGMRSDASSWQLAAETQTPVLFTLKPGGASLSIAALINGFLHFREQHQIAGVLLNECTPKMADRMASMIECETGLKVYGAMPKLIDVNIKSRHLGLVTPNQIEDIQDKISLLAEAFESNVDVSALLLLADTADPVVNKLPKVSPVGQNVRIAVAQDEAFCFYYQENLELLQSLGSELVFFSPVHDKTLPENTHAIYLGGGYPELYAHTLSENHSMIASIQEAMSHQIPMIAECGGFLYLQDTLSDSKNETYPMVAALRGNSYPVGKLEHFGYIELTSNRKNDFMNEGDTIRGHEFHYWESDIPGDDFLAQKPYSKQAWFCAHALSNVYAGFPHLYFWSNTRFAKNFVRAADEFRKKVEESLCKY